MRDHRSLHAWQEARAVVLGVIKPGTYWLEAVGLRRCSPSCNGPAFRYSSTSQRATLTAIHPLSENISLSLTDQQWKHGELLELALEVQAVSQEPGTVSTQKEPTKSETAVRDDPTKEWLNTAHCLAVSRSPLTLFLFPLTVFQSVFLRRLRALRQEQILPQHRRQ